MIGRIRLRWIRHAALLLRLSRFAAYALITLSGIAAVMLPPASVSAASGRPFIVLVWAGLMSVASAFCAYGAITNRWVGEYIGLWPLSMVAAIFGVSALARGTTAWSGGLFLLAFFWFWISRWQEVALLRVEAVKTAEERHEGVG